MQHLLYNTYLYMYIHTYDERSEARVRDKFRDRRLRAAVNWRDVDGARDIEAPALGRPTGRNPWVPVGLGFFYMDILFWTVVQMEILFWTFSN